LVRDESRVTPPLSRRSTSADLAEASLADPSRNGVRVRVLTAGGFADLGGEFLEIRCCLVECVLAFELGAKGDLQEFGCRESASLQFFVQIVG
jgi:hypothetical protein